MSEGLEAADLLIGYTDYADDALRILGPSGPVLAASGFHEWGVGRSQGTLGTTATTTTPYMRPLKW